jgi:hypothetical protein
MSDGLGKTRRTPTLGSGWELWSVQPGRTSTRGSGLNFCPKPNSTARLILTNLIDLHSIQKIRKIVTIFKYKQENKRILQNQIELMNIDQFYAVQIDMFFSFNLFIEYIY